MALVSYSDSEGSDTEQQSALPQKLAAKPPTSQIASFAVDRSNPRKIRVNLQEQPTDTNGDHEDAPAPKRARVGGGAFSNFGAMLPAPKKSGAEATQTATSKAPARKVFSLKTGAEPAFSRESDADLRHLFEDENHDQRHDKSEVKIDEERPQPSHLIEDGTPETTQPILKGNASMFKPLSVVRNTKKKKSVVAISGPASTTKIIEEKVHSTPSEPVATPKKVGLFSAHAEEEPVELDSHLAYHERDNGNAIDADEQPELESQDIMPASHPDLDQPQSLETIASDLRLSAADRRQLFGRGGKLGTAVNVVNFNTDQEYAANEELRAAGEQVQHNPVRGIAPGKHSLRQLMNSAVTQKDALEESFAQGRRNKKEAGNKYGW